MAKRLGTVKQDSPTSHWTHWEYENRKLRSNSMRGQVLVQRWRVREKRPRRWVELSHAPVHIEGVKHLPVLPDVVRTAPEVIIFSGRCFPP